MIEDGGPAYPCQPLQRDGLPIAVMEPGLSIRDHFAGLAMQALLHERNNTHIGKMFDQLRADLAAAVAITAARDETIAELELRLRISRQSNKELRESAEQAEARLAAIDNAPTVAVVCSSHSFGQFVQQRFFGSQLPRIGTELIARPAKD